MFAHNIGCCTLLQLLQPRVDAADNPAVPRHMPPLSALEYSTYTLGLGQVSDLLSAAAVQSDCHAID